MQLDFIGIGQFIQTCRKGLGLTQNEVGERIGVTPQAVSNWERGESLPEVSLLPDLARVLRCSVDAILSGGNGCGGYRRHITVAHMKEALGAINRVGELLDRDHFIYSTIIDALNTRMNTTIELAFSDPHIFEVFTIELLMECVRKGDYVDPRDVLAHLEDCRARDGLLSMLDEYGVK